MFVRIDPRCKREKAQAESRRELHDAPARRVKNSRFAGISGDGGGRDRTCDLELRRLLLYPLSYAPRFRSTVPVFPNRAARPFWGFWMRVESAAREIWRRTRRLVSVVAQITGPVARSNVTVRVVVAPRGDGVRRRQLAPRTHDRPWSGRAISVAESNDVKRPTRPTTRTPPTAPWSPLSPRTPCYEQPTSQSRTPTPLSTQPPAPARSHSRRRSRPSPAIHPSCRRRRRSRVHRGDRLTPRQAQPAHHTQWPARRAAPTGRAHKPARPERFAMTTVQWRT